MKKILFKIYLCLFILASISFLLGYMINIPLEYSPNLQLTFSEILVNNMFVNYRAIFLAVLSLGIYSLIFVVNELLFLGVVIKSLAVEQSLGYAFSFIAFHGIVEIPTIILAATIGVNIWINIIMLIKKKITLHKLLKFNGFLLLLLIGFIILAALMESYGTTYILEKFIL
ncbi:stage II sporulation protein M [Amphibacillus jilinensis]|uniref:stage II sporulation protein M n=1 Tax=Amphibacillus jilinensis TaxID=1216008 RepID=UPI0003148B5B|nr:stage II sporulation protein M [Amphibacillus jilinensis]